jgi:hypothetical protein
MTFFLARIRRADARSGGWVTPYRGRDTVRANRRYGSTLLWKSEPERPFREISCRRPHENGSLTILQTRDIIAN